MKLLMPVDGSECSASTLVWAADTFDKQVAEYYLLFVIPVLPDLATVEYDISDATAMLKNARAELERLGCRVTRTDYLLGDAVVQIERYADEIGADQVVIGSHGRGGLARLLMGSVSLKLLEQCRCPVTVHRNVGHPERESRGGSDKTLL